MAITRDKKVQMVADYVDKVTNSPGIILTDYRGLTVAQLSDLRRRLREADGGLQIVKNTLLRRALEEAGRPVPDDKLEGPLAMGYAAQEMPPVARVLSEFAKQTGTLKIRGAILGTNVLDPAGVQALADLPSREVLLAQLLGSVQGPMSSMVTTISAPLRELAQVLKARGEQGQEAAA